MPVPVHRHVPVVSKVQKHVEVPVKETVEKVIEVGGSGSGLVGWLIGWGGYFFFIFFVLMLAFG